MNKKKIIHIVESWGSGVFSFLVDLVNKTNNDYEIIILHGRREETFEDYKEYFPKNVKLIEIANFTRSINPVKDIKAFFEIRKLLKKECPDIVHLHSSKAGFLGRFAVNTKKTKVLYNPHGFAYLAKDISKLKSSIYWLAEKIAAMRNCTIIGCSHGEYEEALKLTKNSTCINNGVDTDKLSDITKNFQEKEIDFDNLKIATIGRIGSQKNPVLFNEIAKKFLNYKFTWIGEGTDKTLLTSSNITITGWLNKERVLETLNKNDVFVLTSLWEGLPISLLEAMFLKKVCIVSNCIGNRDVIKNEYNGFICKNLQEFESILDTLKTKNLNQLKLNAIKDINEIFNLNKMIDGYKKIYE